MTGRLGWLSVAALGINTIVGSGIFRLPAEMARALGPASIVVFVVSAAWLSIVALAFAEAASQFQKDGGAYLFASEAFGRRAGYVVGWTVWIATLLTWATVAMAIPGQLPIGPWGVPLIIVGLGAASLRGVAPAAWVSTFFAVVKLVPLVLFVVVGVFHVRGEHFTPFAPLGYGQWPATAVIAFFALSGFETSAIPGSSNPRIAYTVVASLVGASLLYALIQLVALGVDPNVASSEHPLADAAAVFLGPLASDVFRVAGGVSMLGLCSAMAVCSPVLLQAFARDGLLPAHSHRASVVIGTVGTLMAVYLYDFRGLVGFTSVTLILQYIAVCVAVVVLRKKHPRSPRLLAVPTPLLAIAVAGLAGLLLLCERGELIGAAVVLAVGALLAWRA